MRSDSKLTRVGNFFLKHEVLNIRMKKIKESNQDKKISCHYV